METDRRTLRGLLLIFGLCIVISQGLSAHAAEDETTVWSSKSLGHAADGRPLYSVDNPPDFPVLNSVVGPDYEAERYFLRVLDEDGAEYFGDSDDVLELTVGGEYEVRIYYCNSAEAAIASWVYAKGVKAHLYIPSVILRESELRATLSALNTTPESVSCTLQVHTEKPLRLESIDTPTIVNQSLSNGSTLSANKLFGEGVDIGTNSLSGIVLNGQANAGYVRLCLKAVALDDEETPASDIEEVDNGADEVLATQSAEENKRSLLHEIFDGMPWYHVIGLFCSVIVGIFFVTFVLNWIVNRKR